jgi:hypothetical protein
MFGLCLAAALVAAAMAAVPALGAKKEFSVNTFTQYKECPFEDPAMLTHNAVCIFGQTTKGAKGGYFSLGLATVKLNKPVSIQAGVYYDEEAEEYRTVAPANGKTLESPELSVVRGLKIITKAIQNSAGWPASLKESYNAAIKNKESAVGVTLELAGGNLLYETPNSLNPTNLAGESGFAFILPMKVKLSNSWLEKLGGVCEIGNDEHPVMQHLTTEPPGWATIGGTGIQFNETFTNVEVPESKLVDLSWPIEAASAPSECGGEYASYIELALKQALRMESVGRGTTVLQGTLWDGDFGSAKVALGK